MATKTMFKDALDYIFIGNGIAPDSYLISNEVAASNHLVGAVVTAAANGVIMSNSGSSSGSSNNFFVNTSSTSAATATAAAAAATSSPAIVAAGMENLYSNVAIGLGTMLINDSLLQDMNSTSIYGLLANESDLSKNGTDDDIASEDIAELVKMAATSIVLGLMILVTIIGNVFVIAAIILERNLQNVANYLVASLAVADLFVACLVMPLGAVYEISQGWILGPELCDIWTSCDVLCCTASILHLVAIATDRYWAVTNIDYMHSRTSKRVFLMIFCVWFASVIVSLAPQFGWKDPDYLQRIEQQKCMVSQDVAYQVFATCCTFYVPLLVILVLYWKIYQTARKRIHRRRPRPIDVTANNNQPDLSQKKRKRLKLRIGKFSGDKGKTGATLGLVEGNSTNTVNTVEDTEFSSSNVDSKSRAGIEVTTIFSNPEEAPTTSTSQISTVSHLVALANQQHHHQPPSTTTTATSKTEHNQNMHNTHQLQQHLQEHHQQHHTQQHHHHHPHPHTHTHHTQHQQLPPQQQIAIASSAANGTTNTIQSAAATTTITTTATTTDKQSNNAAAQPAIASAAAATVATTPTATNDSGDVLEDPQLQQQLQQVAAQTTATATSTSATTNTSDVVITTAGGGVSGTTTSAATTITSISALSPTTPLNSSCGGITQLTAAPTSGVGQTSAATAASNQVTPVPHTKQSHQNLSSISNPQSKVTKRKETLEAKRERKAAKTLAIITGAFVVCWLPFFVLALLLPLCDDCEINDAIASFFLWMGYFNSTLNPVIYTIFSPEFRQAFKRILFGGHRPVHYRSGKI